MESLANERGLIVSWLIKLGVGLALLGIVVYDGGSILVNYFGVDSAAEEIATDISTEIASGTDMTAVQVEQRAKELAKNKDARLLSAQIDRDGVLHIKLRRKADTLVVGRLSFARGWTKATAEAQAGTKPAS